MLPRMNASESNTLDRILKLHEDELIEETLSGLPDFILERHPRVIIENTGAGLGRWLMFGGPPRVDWLELAHLSYYLLTERYVDGDAA